MTADHLVYCWGSNPACLRVQGQVHRRARALKTQQEGSNVTDNSSENVKIVDRADSLVPECVYMGPIKTPTPTEEIDKNTLNVNYSKLPVAAPTNNNNNNNNHHTNSKTIVANNAAAGDAKISLLKYDNNSPDDINQNQNNPSNYLVSNQLEIIYFLHFR